MESAYYSFWWLSAVIFKLVPFFFFIPAGCSLVSCFGNRAAGCQLKLLQWRGKNSMLHQGNLHFFNISLLFPCVLLLNSLPALWLDLCISICMLKCFWFPIVSDGGRTDSTRFFFYHTSVKLILSFVLSSLNNDQSLVIFSVDRD